MTAIVYYKGKLIGDNKHALLCNPFAFEYGPKVYVSRCGSFAYGTSGPSITESFRDRVEHALRVILEHHVLVSNDINVITKYIREEVSRYITNTIVVTRNLPFFIMDKGNDIQLRSMAGSAHGIGSGGLILVALLRCGVKVPEAMRLAALYDDMTGSEGDVIHTKDLKPFTILGTEL